MSFFLRLALFVCSFDCLLVRFFFRRHQGKPEEALQEAFFILRQDKEWGDGKARQFCIHVFNALGDAHPAVSAGRRRLSNLVL